MGSTYLDAGRVQLRQFVFVVDRLSRFTLIAHMTDEACEDDPQRQYLGWLDEQDGGEEAREQRRQPLLRLAVAELDAASDGEEDAQRHEHERRRIGDEHAPPRKHHP